MPNERAHQNSYLTIIVTMCVSRPIHPRTEVDMPNERAHQNSYLTIIVTMCVSRPISEIFAFVHAF